MNFLNTGFDHVEFVLNSFDSFRPVFTRLGFERVGSRDNYISGMKQELWQQGFVRILLSQADMRAKGTLEYDFLTTFGEGACTIGVEVEDAEAAYLETTRKGAKSALEPVRKESDSGAVTVAEIFTPGKVRYRFVSRTYPNKFAGRGHFLPGFQVAKLESPMPEGVHSIDHLTNNIPMGEMKTWSSFYSDIFSFIVTRSFHIKTGRTGLISDVVESKCGRIKVPINEATEKESQVQEFVDRMNGGAGVQHLAFLTLDIMNAIPSLKEKAFEFLKVPHSYYEAVPKRVPNVTEDLSLLEQSGILLDGDKSGYLLQIFTQEALGPFFFEFIQRKGNRGFGEGNFQALFEAIERDQVRRGVLV